MQTDRFSQFRPITAAEVSALFRRRKQGSQEAAGKTPSAGPGHNTAPHLLQHTSTLGMGAVLLKPSFETQPSDIPERCLGLPQRHAEDGQRLLIELQGLFVLLRVAAQESHVEVGVAHRRVLLPQRLSLDDQRLDSRAGFDTTEM